MNPHKRFTAGQALVHPWIADVSNEALLSKTVELSELKKFQGSKKLKGAVKTIMAINKMKNLFGNNKASLKLSNKLRNELPHTIDARYTIGKLITTGSLQHFVSGRDELMIWAVFCR